MMRFRTTSVATAIVMCLSGVIPAQAFQMPAVQTTQADNLPVVKVQDQFKPWLYNRENRERARQNANRPDWARSDRGGRDSDRYSGNRGRYDRPSRDRYDYYNGHRGYSDRRPGYRYHNGYWFPMAAFAAGAIIGGAMQQGQPSYGNSHTSWCANRWRSYRAYDNTYQPYNGPRAQCVSPYGR
jgi:hypothetical protein